MVDIILLLVLGKIVLNISVDRTCDNGDDCVEVSIDLDVYWLSFVVNSNLSVVTDDDDDDDAVDAEDVAIDVCIDRISEVVSNSLDNEVKRVEYESSVVASSDDVGSTYFILPETMFDDEVWGYFCDIVLKDVSEWSEGDRVVLGLRDGSDGWRVVFFIFLSLLSAVSGDKICVSSTLLCVIEDAVVNGNDVIFPLWSSDMPIDFLKSETFELS